jgi:formate dehydrogenase subunit gamma
MFNPGQKLLAWALTVSVTAVIVTGIQAWSAHVTEGSLHGAAVVLTALLLGAHLFMAIVNPATRPALAGMAFGRVRRSWAAEHHRGWLDDLDESARRRV